MHPLTDGISHRELTAVVERLPPVASVIRRLMAVLEDPNSDVTDISALIRVDPALAAQVLRLANSPAYSRPGGVASIEEAVQQTGVAEVTRLVSTLAARQLIMRPLRRYQIPAEALWPHALAVALGGELVAERFLGDASAAYLAGLLHTIGMVALDGIALARRIPPRPAHVPMPKWEKQHFGTDNATVAANLLQHWEFPVAMVNAVATRYQVPRPETLPELGGTLYLASAMAERVPAGLMPEFGLFRITPAILESLRLSRDDYSQLELGVHHRLSRLRALF